MRVDAPEIIAAVELASDLRKRMGKRKLSDLPKGVPHNPRTCILAKAFNFDCRIAPSPNGRGGRGWYVNFHNATDAQAEILAKWAEDNGLQPLWWGQRAYALPREVGNVAQKFDNGELPEYHRRKK